MHASALQDPQPDLVEGKPRPPERLTCNWARRWDFLAAGHPLCGPEGRYWEARDG